MPTSNKTRRDELPGTQNRDAPSTAAPPQKLRARLRAHAEKAQDTRLARAISRYLLARGNTLAGGIAYYALFSLASGLTIGLTIGLKLIGSHETLRLAVYKNIDKLAPGILSWPGHPGLVNPDNLVDHFALNLTSLIAALALTYSAIEVMGMLKKSIRAMFGITLVPDNFIYEKLRNLLGFILISAGITTTALVSLLNAEIRHALQHQLHTENPLISAAFIALSILSGALIDALIMLLLIRVISRVRVPRKDLLLGLTLFALASALLRVIGSIAPHVSDNVILASAATLAALLLWINILARIILLCCAYICNPPRVDRKENLPDMHADETPNYISLSAPHTLNWQLPTT